jgi:transposase
MGRKRAPSGMVHEEIHCVIFAQSWECRDHRRDFSLSRPGSLLSVSPISSPTRSPACGGRKKGGPDNAIGRSRGGLSTKINAVVDQQGMLVRIVLSQGQSSDKTIAPTLIEGFKPDRVLVADRGYDARAIIELVEARGGRADIPTSRDRKVQRSVDHLIYRKRNLIERFFNKLKHFRRVATRYDKTARNFLAAVLLAATRLWAKFD